MENEKRKRAAELEGINNKLKNLNKEKTEKLDNLKQAWNQQQQTLATEKKTQAEIIGKEEKEEQRRISSIKAEYEADMQKELHSQGADTERFKLSGNTLAMFSEAVMVERTILRATADEPNISSPSSWRERSTVRFYNILRFLRGYQGIYHNDS